MIKFEKLKFSHPSHEVNNGIARIDIKGGTIDEVWLERFKAEFAGERTFYTTLSATNVFLMLNTADGLYQQASTGGEEELITICGRIVDAEMHEANDRLTPLSPVLFLSGVTQQPNVSSPTRTRLIQRNQTAAHAAVSFDDIKDTHLSLLELDRTETYAHVLEQWNN